MYYILLCQSNNESNGAYFTRFKSAVGTLKVVGGEHILVGEQKLGKPFKIQPRRSIRLNRSISRMLASFLDRTSLDSLKSLMNCGRYRYSTTLISTFNVLVQESGDYDQINTQGSKFMLRYGGVFLLRRGDVLA